MSSITSGKDMLCQHRKSIFFVHAKVINAHITGSCRGQKRLVFGTSKLHFCVLEWSSPAEQCDALWQESVRLEYQLFSDRRFPADFEILFCVFFGCFQLSDIRVDPPQLRCGGSTRLPEKLWPRSSYLHRVVLLSKKAARPEKNSNISAKFSFFAGAEPTESRAR